MRTKQAVKKLQARGLNAIPVDGGIVVWRKAGFSLAETKGGAISIMCQVQIMLDFTSITDAEFTALCRLFL